MSTRSPTDGKPVIERTEIVVNGFQREEVVELQCDGESVRRALCVNREIFEILGEAGRAHAAADIQTTFGESLIEKSTIVTSVVVEIALAIFIRRPRSLELDLPLLVALLSHEVAQLLPGNTEARLNEEPGGYIRMM